MEELIESLMAEKEDAIKRGDMNEASRIYREQQDAEKKLEQVRARFQKRSQGKLAVVTENDIGGGCIRVDEDSGAEADRV